MAEPQDEETETATSGACCGAAGDAGPGGIADVGNRGGRGPASSQDAGAEVTEPDEETSALDPEDSAQPLSEAS